MTSIVTFDPGETTGFVAAEWQGGKDFGITEVAQIPWDDRFYQTRDLLKFHLPDYVVIEDADLRPQDLVEHMKTFSLHSITIKDMTKVLGLTGNYAYVIWPKSKPKEEPNLGGEWIW